MTSQVKGVINHNFPIVVKLVEESGTERVIKESDGPTGALELDQWFSGKQQIIIQEKQSS